MGALRVRGIDQPVEWWERGVSSTDGMHAKLCSRGWTVGPISQAAHHADRSIATTVPSSSSKIWSCCWGLLPSSCSTAPPVSSVFHRCLTPIAQQQRQQQRVQQRRSTSSTSSAGAALSPAGSAARSCYANSVVYCHHIHACVQLGLL